jgi:predicted DNA-binding protein with PD1-like motif
MRATQLAQADDRTFVIVFERGEEAVDGLQRFAREHQVTAGRFTGLGAFSSVVLGFFDRERKDYDRIVLDEQVEVLSLIGNFARQKNDIKTHAHIVVGKRDGRAYGGHLLEGRVWPTLEISVVDVPAYLCRETDAETGLPLLRP